MAVGILATIIVFLFLGMLGMGGVIWWLFTQQDDDDPDHPKIVLPDVKRIVKESLAKHLDKKPAGTDGWTPSGTGGFLYSSVDERPPTSVVPLLIGPVPAVQQPNTRFQSNATVPENAVHKRLFTHASG